MGRQQGNRLRSGFTTGTAAAAAARAVLVNILSGYAPRKVTVVLPIGDTLEIKVQQCHCIDDNTGICSVIKDAGDDPDITHGAEIGARVTWQEGGDGNIVEILGGHGVGTVTKPGLEVPPGQPAINSGPREMIRRSVVQAMADHDCCGRAIVEIFVPDGVELARHTLNERLGIVGGISILGTTGVVRPLSHAAYVATIRAAFSVAKASGLNRVVLTTGRRSERLSQVRWPQLPTEGFVQIGDYFAKSMEMAAEMKLKQVVLAVFFGKAVKMAQGIAHTHARSARLTLKTLAHWALEITGSGILAQEVASANTARQAFDMIKDSAPALIEKVGREIVTAATAFGEGRVTVRAVIFGFDEKVRFDSFDT